MDTDNIYYGHWKNNNWYHSCCHRNRSNINYKYSWNHLWTNNNNNWYNFLIIPKRRKQNRAKKGFKYKKDPEITW